MTRQSLSLDISGGNEPKGVLSIRIECRAEDVARLAAEIKDLLLPKSEGGQKSPCGCGE